MPAARTRAEMPFDTDFFWRAAMARQGSWRNVAREAVARPGEADVVANQSGAQVNSRMSTRMRQVWHRFRCRMGRRRTSTAYGRGPELLLEREDPSRAGDFSSEWGFGLERRGAHYFLLFIQT